MGVQISGKGVKKLTIEEKTTIIAYRNAGMKTKDIIARTGRNATTITRVLAASKKLQNSGIPERKKGSEGPESDQDCPEEPQKADLQVSAHDSGPA